VSHIQAPFVNLRGSYTVTIIGTNGCGTSAIYTITSGSCSPVLSTHMVDFTATRQPGGVLLDWQVAAGYTNGYFLVQRSNNASNWQTIGVVNQQGSNTGLSISHFVDSLPAGGTNYYRIKAVNSNAAPEFTPVKQVEMPLNATVSLYPNPTHGPLVLEFNSTAAGLVKACITYVAGKPIFYCQPSRWQGF
jgi:hypothetical protein